MFLLKEYFTISDVAWYNMSHDVFEAWIAALLIQNSGIYLDDKEKQDPLNTEGLSHAGFLCTNRDLVLQHVYD